MAAEAQELASLQSVCDATLNRSVNVIAEYVAARLPEGWEIEISLEAEEAGIRLFDPGFNEIDLGKLDCSIREMCEFATECEANMPIQIDKIYMGM